jgi:hypothetical protein
MVSARLLEVERRGAAGHEGQGAVDGRDGRGGDGDAQGEQVQRRLLQQVVQQLRFRGGFLIEIKRICQSGPVALVR